jgi:hypothetical protein
VERKVKEKIQHFILGNKKLDFYFFFFEMFAADFDAVFKSNTDGDEEKELKKLYSIMSSSPDDNNDTIQIGKTTYYKVRKGNQNYRIVSGKKMSDHEFCWRVETDRTTKKNYFVNGLDNRKWHLPDIFQTEAERVKEIQMLKEKKRKQEEEEAEKKKDREYSRRQGEKFELSGPGAADAPFHLLQNESEILKGKQKGEENPNKKQQGCPCVVQ